MAYKIVPLPADLFAGFRNMDAPQLAARGARRVIADADRGFPCRVSLEDARRGETVLLVNYVSNDVPGPYRTAYAIYVREGVPEAESLVDRLPSVFEGRSLSLRGLDDQGNLVSALLAPSGHVEDGIEQLFADQSIACIHAHNAAYGCYAARIERHGGVA